MCVQLDLPLSVVFYKWLLGEERCLDHTDLVHIDPAIARSVHQLYTVLREKQRIDADHSHVSAVSVRICYVAIVCVLVTCLLL